MIDLNIQVEELISQNANDFQISKVFKNYFKNYVASIDTTLETTGGKDFFVKHTKHTDKFLILLYKYILRKNFGSYQPMGSSIPISLIALGSYGRQQLCIYSDIDIMILYEDVKGYNLKEIMEEFITLAWDCGLKLGSRVHELKEVALSVEEDITIKSSILESRMIFGSKYLWYGYENVLSLIRKKNQKEFVLEKLEEHKQRLTKYPLKMEPNIKDGFGGIRESNMMYWMANILYGTTDTKNLIGTEFGEEEYKKYRHALEYIFQVRNALHNIARKKQDLVTFDILPDLSTKLGFENKPRHTKERQCMARLLTCLHIIHSFTATMVKKFTRKVIFKSENIIKLKEHRYKKNLYIVGNTLYTSFNAKPKSLNLLLKELTDLPATVTRFDRSYIYYASKAKIPVTRTKELNKNIKSMLFKKALYPVIKLIYNAGLFTAILPMTKKIIDQPQFDGYHQHPVDVHSIKTLKFAENITDPYIQDIYDSLTKQQQSVTKLVALFHDMGKGRPTDHHILGEKIFKEMAISLGLDDSHARVGARLVRYHNMMSYIATHEDIYSEKTILNFTGLIKTELALRMLYVVTYCDISAVGKNIYNSSTKSLLRQLYTQSIPAFENEDLLNESSRRVAKQNTIKNLKRYKELPNILKKKVMYIASNQMFLRMKAEDILDISIKAKDVNDYIYKILNTTYLTIRIIRKVPLNLGYLLGKLEFLNISSMHIFKLYDDKKTFEISFSEKVNEEDIPYIEDVIQNSFDMSKSTKLTTPVIKKDNIKVNINHTTYLASMQIKAKDQRGLFAYIAKIFDDFGLEIETAKLHTSKGNARDLLLIEKNGNFCAKQDEIVDLICNNTQ